MSHPDGGSRVAWRCGTAVHPPLDLPPVQGGRNANGPCGAPDDLCSLGFVGVIPRFGLSLRRFGIEDRTRRMRGRFLDRDPAIPPAGDAHIDLRRLRQGEKGPAVRGALQTVDARVRISPSRRRCRPGPCRCSNPRRPCPIRLRRGNAIPRIPWPRACRSPCPSRGVCP